jgi:hypothetical protein
MGMDITKQAVIKELSRFTAPARLAESAAEALTMPAPPEWGGFLDEGAEHTALTFYWRSMAARVPNIAAFLKRNLQKLFVLEEQRGGLSLLYAYTVGGDDLNFYQGRPPLGEPPAQFKAVWERIPAELRHFYLRIHNGWTFVPADSMGPLPVQDWRYLSDDGFDIDDDVADGLPMDISKTLAVFHNGAGDYLCLDFSAPSGEATGVIWWHDNPEQPEVVDFWAVLDAWLGIFLEEADAA